MIKELLTNKNAREQATIKGIEVAKIGAVPRTRKGGYEIEILSMKAREEGVTVFVRAWNRDGQIGFGPDGTVDIEKFNQINPTVFIRQEDGPIVIREADPETSRAEVRGREDPLEALYRSIVMSLNVKTQIFDSSKIIPGKIGQTTTNVVPADDDCIFANSATYSIAQGATTGTLRGDGIAQNTLSGSYFVERTFLNFASTAAVGGDTIDSATLTVTSTTESDADSASVNIYGSTASDTVVADDFDLVQDTPFSTAKSIASDWNATGANAFTLNASGIAQITKSSALTKYSMRQVQDVSVSTPTGVNSVNIDLVGDGTDPQLSIEHSAGAPTPNVSDAVSIGESVTIDVSAGNTSVSDSVSIGESVTINVSDVDINISDAVSVADSASMSTGTDISISVTDSVSIGDSPTIDVFIPGQMSATDTVTIAESVTVEVSGAWKDRNKPAIGTWTDRTQPPT